MGVQMFSRLRETIGRISRSRWIPHFPFGARQSPGNGDVNLKTKARKWERNSMSMLAFDEKGTRRPPLFHHITHTRHTSPHFLWPLVQKTPLLIVCDGFSPWNKMWRSGWNNWRPDEGRTGRNSGGEGGVMREGIKENESIRKGQRG